MTKPYTWKEIYEISRNRNKAKKLFAEYRELALIAFKLSKYIEGERNITKKYLGHLYYSCLDFFVLDYLCCKCPAYECSDCLSYKDLREAYRRAYNRLYGKRIK